MDIGDLKTKIEELSDSLQFAATKADETVKNLKETKEIEIDLRAAAAELKKQSEELERRIAKTVTKEVLENLNTFFENSAKIRESATAIHQANMQIQQVHQNSCKTRALIYGILGLITGAGAAAIFFLKI